MPVFVQLLSSPSDDVREQVGGTAMAACTIIPPQQAVWALGNIAGDSPKCRDLVLETNALPPLLEQLKEGSKVSMLRNATWTLSNFCRGKPQPAFTLTKMALPTLARLIHFSDEEVLTDACWALSYLSDGTNDKIQEVIQAGVVRRLVELLLYVVVGVFVCRQPLGCAVQSLLVLWLRVVEQPHPQAPIDVGAGPCPAHRGQHRHRG